MSTDAATRIPGSGGSFRGRCCTRRTWGILATASVAGALAASLADAAAAGTPATSRVAATAAVGIKPAARQDRAPIEESLVQRRAVRGTPVDDSAESPELGEVRRFEEQAFPRRTAGPSRADADTVLEPVPSLPGRWDGTGDVPEVFRAPETTPTPSKPPFTRDSPRDSTPDSEWLRSLATPELPVRWDPQVLRYLDYFKNDPRGRAVMSNWLRRAGRFRSLFETVLEREGLPKDLFYVAMVESGFDTSARSRTGAGGIWQFMPGAAKAYGLEVGYWVDARRDPERSVEAAARYLKDLYVRFGSWHLVFASYNAGYGAVLKSITRYNTNDYWELCHHEAGLPWESSLYVPKILAAAIVGHNLQAFGYGDIMPDPPFAYDQVEVPPGTGFSTVARAIKVKPEVIAALNPQILRERTPPDRATVELRLPVGTAGLFAEAFDRSRTPGDRLETVTLRFGESLDDLAKGRGISVRELKRLNGVRDTGELRAGTTILVPQRPSKVARRVEVPEPGKPGDKPDQRFAAPTPAGETSADATSPPALEGAIRADGSPGSSQSTIADDEEILVAVPDRVFNDEGRERVFYRTREGDSVDDIAEAVGVRPDEVIDWNSLDPSAKLHPKMVLQLFVRKNFDPSRVVFLDPARIRVVTLGSDEFLDLEAARRGKKRLVIEAKVGDTLARIGRRYGLTTGDLARINHFSYNTEVQRGQKIVVYSPLPDASREAGQGMAPELRRDRTAATVNRGGASRAIEKPVRRSPEKLAAKSVKPSVPKPGPAGAVREAQGGMGVTRTGKSPAVRAVVANVSGDKGRDKPGVKPAPRSETKMQPPKAALPSKRK